MIDRRSRYIINLNIAKQALPTFFTSFRASRGIFEVICLRMPLIRDYGIVNYLIAILAYPLNVAIFCAGLRTGIVLFLLTDLRLKKVVRRDIIVTGFAMCLGKELINMHQEVITGRTHLDNLSQTSYFISRWNEVQLAYERDMAEEEAAVRSEQQTRENDIRMLLKKFSPETVADTLEIPLDQVQQIVVKNKPDF